MFRVKTFDAVESSIHEVGNDFIATVQSGMRKNCNTTGVMNQTDCVRRGDFEFANPRRAIFSQEPFKGFVGAGTETALH